VLVVGSTNTDMVVKTPALPAPGQTVLGGAFRMTPGGKGANQAVAAARAGGEVTFITAVGDDGFGAEHVIRFRQEGISNLHRNIKRSFYPVSANKTPSSPRVSSRVSGGSASSGRNAPAAWFRHQGIPAALPPRGLSFRIQTVTA
jgi:hypothetical protein